MMNIRQQNLPLTVTNETRVIDGTIQKMMTTTNADGSGLKQYQTDRAALYGGGSMLLEENSRPTVLS